MLSTKMVNLDYKKELDTLDLIILEETKTSFKAILNIVDDTPKDMSG
jgi:hypothetical protein